MEKAAKVEEVHRKRRQSQPMSHPKASSNDGYGQPSCRTVGSGCPYLARYETGASKAPVPEGTCPMPNSRPFTCQCAHRRQGVNVPSGGALEGLTFGHRECPGRGGFGCRGTGGVALVGQGHVDMLDGRRPTGAPYFTHESKKSCLPSQAPLAEASTFTFNDWLETTENRKPPAHLHHSCVPSVCSLCGPHYERCSQEYSNPEAYVLSKMAN